MPSPMVSIFPVARSGGSGQLSRVSLRFAGALVLPTSWGIVPSVTGHHGDTKNSSLDLLWGTSDLPLGKLRLGCLQH